MHYCRVLSIEPSPPVLDVLAANVMPTLVKFLGFHDHQELQFEAAWALTNIASTDQTRQVHCENRARGSGVVVLV